MKTVLVMLALPTLVMGLCGISEVEAANMPRDETALISVVENARRQYESASNDMAKGAARPTRAAAICAQRHGLSVSNWIGTISKLSTNGSGKGVLSVEIGSNTSVKTWNNDLSDIANNTLIPPTSPVFAAASSLREGTLVRFSGTFFSSAEDCIEESSMSLAGSITEPEFIFRFTAIDPNVSLNEEAAPVRQPEPFRAQSESQANVPLEWQDVLPQVKQMCANKWTADYEMQAFCIKQQREGWNKLHEDDQPVRRQEHTSLQVEPLSGKNYVITSIDGVPTQSHDVQTSATISPSTPLPASQAYTEGRNARIAYENWFNALAHDDYRAGAEYWAGHRSAKPEPTCHYTSAAFEAGCLEAKRITTPADARRKSEPDFKLGWNSL